MIDIDLMMLIHEIDLFGLQIGRNVYNNNNNCVNSKILEHDWLLIALIYSLIGCFQVQTARFDMSDYKHL